MCTCNYAKLIVVNLLIQELGSHSQGDMYMLLFGGQSMLQSGGKGLESCCVVWAGRRLLRGGAVHLVSRQNLKPPASWLAICSWFTRLGRRQGCSARRWRHRSRPPSSTAHCTCRTYAAAGRCRGCLAACRCTDPAGPGQQRRGVQPCEPHWELQWKQARAMELQWGCSGHRWRHRSCRES